MHSALPSLVFDLGGTHTRLALTDGKRLSEVQRFDTDPSKHGLTTFLAHIDELLALVGQPIGGIIGGMPGQLDPETGRLLHAPNLAAWQGMRVAKQIEQHFNVPLALHNDTELVGLGEASFGAGKGAKIVVYITVSTGVNGIRIENGHIETSARGIELGAQLLPGPGGTLQSLEELTGGASLARHYGRPPRNLRGDKALWHQEAAYLAEGLYNALVLWSPDVVVFGGSMMRDIDLHEVARHLRTLPTVFSSWPPLHHATLGDDGGLYGGMALVAAHSAP